jgi:RND family efflux transporter MFP subunit
MKFLRSLLTLVAALALVACHSKKEAGPESLPPVAVRTVVAENKERPSSEEVVGTVRAKLRATIEAKVSARIEALLVAPGQMVKTGDLIAQLDPREIQAKLDQALALRQQATRDLARGRELLDKKITTQADFDAVQARASVAEGAAREMETMLGYTKIVAPFDGIVTRKLADVGDLAAPGKPIIEMEDPRALRFEADVPEALIGHVKLGAKLPVQVAEDSAPIEGTVVEVAPVADPASRTFLVKLDLPTAEGIRSGQFGRVWVPTGEDKSIRVPASAVVSRGQMECIFVVVNQHAQLRLVRTGKRSDGEVEILAGLSPGDRVVSEGAASLRDGQPLTLKQ